ncbi:hypothetical protein [Spiroplasma endosymbiont of Melieria omissa]
MLIKIKRLRKSRYSGKCNPNSRNGGCKQECNQEVRSKIKNSKEYE